MFVQLLFKQAPPLFLATTFLAIFLFSLFTKQKRRRAALPPGPKGWPLIGNMMDIPAREAWLAYTSMGKQYGDMIYLEVMGQPILVLNSLRRANDVLDKRSSNTSDRPVSYMLDVLMEWTQWNTGLMRYGERWRNYRRLLHLHFNKKAVEDHHSNQTQATYTMLHDLLKDPDQFKEHFARQTGSIILKSIYGYDTKPRDDHFVKLVLDAMENLNQATSGTRLVDVFHFLRFIPPWFPGAEFRRVAERGKPLVATMIDEPFSYVKSAMANNTAQPGFVLKYLTELENSTSPDPKKEEAIKYAGGVAYSAGTDTTTTVLLTFLLGMMSNPEAQKRAQREIDSVVGHDRLPAFSDRQDLPYIECILSESTRWQPVGPLGLPHKSIEETMYDGYVIPAGTIITANIWAILHDESTYPDPHNFDPDRYLAKGKDGRPLSPDPALVAFGFGRRVCPGRHFALDTAWITIACILSQFSISLPIDEHGNEVMPRIERKSGILPEYEHFNCKITPRFPERVKHVLAMS